MAIEATTYVILDLLKKLDFHANEITAQRRKIHKKCVHVNKNSTRVDSSSYPRILWILWPPDFENEACPLTTGASLIGCGITGASLISGKLPLEDSGY